MQRRTFLVWFGRTVYTATAALLAAPAVRFLGAPMAAKSGPSRELRKRVARLEALPVGEPQRFAVIGTRQDAWTRYPDQVVGHIWVTRVSPESTPPADTEVTVFNAACPHSGCPVQKAIEEKGYVCHCHGATFAPDGSKLTPDTGFTNPSPRGMDPLEHQIVQDNATGEWWVDVEYKEYEIGLADRIEKA